MILPVAIHFVYIHKVFVFHCVVLHGPLNIYTNEYVPNVMNCQRNRQQQQQIQQQRHLTITIIRRTENIVLDRIYLS